MIIDAMTATGKIEYYKKLLELERRTLESVTEQRDRLATEVTEARAETTRTREFMDHGFKVAKEEITELREQRDRLAEALELLVTTDHESKEAFIERVKQALAAVKGGCDDN
jgi:chromosome segregation ATPase